MIQFLQEYFYQIEEFIRSGGIVMIPLIIVSVIMWILIINRAFFFRQLYRKNMNRKKAGEFVKTNTLPNPSEYMGITALFIREFLHRRSGNTSVDKFILDETVISVVSDLNKYMAFIGILAGIAPLLGLLGTVIGMMTTFDIISIFGTGNAKAMAGGISEALITTQTGLLVAIPGLYIRNFLAQRAENLKYRISSLGIYLKMYV